MSRQGPFFGKRDESASPLTSGSAPASGVGSLGLLGGQSFSAPPTSATTEDGGAKLTVGPNIKLKGVEITDCDTLVVEGTVEATMNSRVILIAERGAFKGSVVIDIAEVRGIFDGDLTARQKLVIHSTGKVTGKIRYGKIVIEEGGQLSGEIAFGTADSGDKAPGAKSILATPVVAAS
jgi:cytoskeletal protein CcmA (bactofilin family)